jgi:nicotinate phosphoribosyltransferase
MKQRIAPETFQIPENEIKSGFFSDAYFLRTTEILNRANYHPTVVMQIFQRQKAFLCGIDEAIAIIKRCAYHPENLILHALYDGDQIEPWETVLTIEGDLANFSHLETVYLGTLSRQTKIATNVRRAVTAAHGKPVLFFPSRFDLYSVQRADGYAAHIGGCFGASTPANTISWGGEALGTIPHALIAAYHGDTVLATKMFDTFVDKSIKRVALVDFSNDCVATSLAVARELGDTLWAVRLDTAANLVDRSLFDSMGQFRPNGVCPELVHNVRNALDDAGYRNVKIMVSGGFTAERIEEFEEAHVPVDTYAIGSSLYDNNDHFTADVVEVDGKPAAKVGRTYNKNPRLTRV